MGELKLNCAACNENLKIDRGCEKDSPIPGRWIVGGYEFQRCPGKLVDLDIGLYIMAYNFYKNGIMMHGKGWGEESAKFIMAIQLIDAEISAIERDALKDATKK